MHEITTQRLVLRRFKPDDAAALFSYLHAPRATCFTSLRLATLEEAEAEAAKRSQSDDCIAVYAPEFGQVIGDLFMSAEEEADTFSVGWNFNADFSGRGYAFEAAHALFEWLFATKNARRLYAYVEDTNHASQRLCKKLGMRQEGLFVEYVSFIKDEGGNPIYENTMQYAILRREWSASKQP